MNAKNNYNSFSNYIMWLSRIALSVIFILSASGKIYEPTSASHFIQYFLPISAQIGISLIWILIFVELFAGVIVFIPSLLRKLLYPLLALVTTFLAGVLLSMIKNLDCGCFGALPFISELSSLAHILLLIGMFLGIYTLARDAKQIKSETLERLGFAAVLIIIAAFLTIPFSLNRQTLSFANETVLDISTVESAVHDDSIQIIDARPEFQFEMGHIPGAINSPYNSNNLNEIIQKHSLKNKSIIVYCSNVHCNAAHILTEKLLEHGYKNVRVFIGGWEEWQQHTEKQVANSL